MKKLLAIFTLALFLGGISATAIAATVDSPVAISMMEEEKKEEKKKAKKSETKKEASDCTSSKKKSDCSKSCDGKSKS